MRQMARVFSLPFIAFTVVAAAATGAGAITVKTQSPVECSADATFTVVRLSPLIIDASVHQRCNTTHALVVTYQPETLTNPQHLAITLEGQQPNVSAPGSASFTNLPYTDSVQNVRI